METGAKKRKRRWLPFWGALLAGLSAVFLFLPKQEQQKNSYVDNHGPNVLANGESHSGPETKSRSGTETKTMSVSFNKLLVPVAGSQGKRYLLAGFTVVGTGGETFKAKLQEHDAQLRDLALGMLATNTMADLEKSGLRQRLRTELINAFNAVIGENSVRELHFTELAIQ
jgi:flagellar basal body-associated protein FliL